MLHEITHRRSEVDARFAKVHGSDLGRLYPDAFPEYDLAA